MKYAVNFGYRSMCDFFYSFRHSVIFTFLFISTPSSSTVSLVPVSFLIVRLPKRSGVCRCSVLEVLHNVAAVSFTPDELDITL